MTGDVVKGEGAFRNFPSLEQGELISRARFQSTREEHPKCIKIDRVQLAYVQRKEYEVTHYNAAGWQKRCPVPEKERLNDPTPLIYALRHTLHLARLCLPESVR